MADARISEISIGDNLLKVQLEKNIIDVLKQRKIKRTACDHDSLVSACKDLNVEEPDVLETVKNLVHKNTLCSKLYGGRIVYGIGLGGLSGLRT